MPKKGREVSPETRAKMSASHLREKNGRWNGGSFVSGKGYVRRLCPNHPCADYVGRVAEGRLIMEAYLGRVLLPEEVVHHINGNPSDNRIENLQLFKNTGDHTGFHNHQRGRTPESIRKQSLSMTGDKNHFYGKRHTIEAKEKMRLTKLSRCLP